MSDSIALTVWYADGLRFSCTQCGNCCSGPPGYVWVSAHEARDIAASLGITLREFRKRHLRRIGTRHSLRELPDGDCEFLVRTPDGKTHCGIYQTRPIQCRTWPFWKSNLKSPETWQQCGQTCPGLNRGEHHSLEVIQAALHGNASRPL